MKLKFSARGFPWQHTGNHWSNQLDKTVHEKYGWNPVIVKGMGRFGGGWAIKCGITISKDFKDFIIELIIGSIRITRE